MNDLIKDVEDSIENKIRCVEKTVVRFPKYKKAIELIDECHHRSKITTEPRCMVLSGETGDGKTTIATDYYRKYPREVTEDGTTVPVFYSAIPSSATVKGLVSRLLEDLGDPLYERGTTIGMTSRFCKLIKECKVELIILDEFQHLINSDSDQVLHSTADWLKDVLNRTKVPIILIGLPKATKILKANAQLMRRFSTRHELCAFRWHPEKEHKEFLTFLKILELAIPKLKPSKLYSHDMAFRVFCATKGIISNIKKLVSKAAQKTYERKLDTITMEVLALAYEEELALSNPSSPNPFLVEYENLKLPSPPQISEDSGDGIGKRGRNNHRKNTSQAGAELLSRR